MTNEWNEECPVPAPVSTNASEFQKLQHMGNIQKNFLCRIQSIERQLINLSFDIAKESTEAGTICRKMVSQFKPLEMAYLEDSRRALRIQSDKVDGNAIMDDFLAKKAKAEIDDRLRYSTDVDAGG